MLCTPMSAPITIITNFHKQNNITPHEPNTSIQTDDLIPLTHTKGLYPKHKMSKITFPLEPILTPIILNYLQ
jgi:hypothetical protein